MENSVKSGKTTQKIEFSLSAKFKINTAYSPNQGYQEMVSGTAYYKAEQRGFIPGYEEGWLEVENDILLMLYM